MSDEYDFAIVGGAALSAVEKPVVDKVAPFPDKILSETAQEQAAEVAQPAVPAANADAEEVDEPKKLTKKQFEKTLEGLRTEWRAFEAAVASSGVKLVVIVEGRDAARDRGIVGRISEFADGRVCRIARVAAPGTRERTQWFFQPYVAHLPAAGEVALFDGGWYARAALDRATGTFSASEYADVLRACTNFESVLVRSGVTIRKYWLSVDGESGEFADELKNLAKRWKVGTKSFADIDYAALRDEILASTESEEAPWNLVSGPDKREVRLRFVSAVAHSVANVATDASAASSAAADAAGPDLAAETAEI